MDSLIQGLIFVGQAILSPRPEASGVGEESPGTIGKHSG